MQHCPSYGDESNNASHTLGLMSSKEFKKNPNRESLDDYGANGEAPIVIHKPFLRVQKRF